jgi:hypothetical protein
MWLREMQRVVEMHTAPGTAWARDPDRGGDGCGVVRDRTPGDGQRTAPPSPAGETLEVPPPPFSEGVFPCSNCHKDMPPNRTRRALEGFHTDIILKHDEQNRWCLDCHNADDRDYLHLASGQKVSFDESYLLCGQCHGEKLRDWRVYVHGGGPARNGRKTYLLCVHCHSPHSPRFTPLVPLPAPTPPVRPGRQP